MVNEHVWEEKLKGQGLKAPKEIILRSDATRCSLLQKADGEGLGREGEKEQHNLRNQSTAAAWTTGRV